MTVNDARVAAAIRSGGVSSSVIYRAVLAAAHDANPTPAAVLDFGSGNGQLLPLLTQAFPKADLHAADIMARPAGLAPGVTWHEGDLNDDLAIEPGSFDVILAVEVIEHLENPRHMLREVARLLKPGGAAILSTPNTGSVRSIITFAVRGHHAQFDDSNYPAHITPVSEVDFVRIGQEAGLDAQRFFYTGSGALPKLLSHRWQDLPVLGKRLTGKRFSDNFGAVFRKAASGASLRS